MTSKETLQSDEQKKFFLLALTFLFLIGVYWLLRSVKDSILASTVGISYQPIAKMASLCFLVPLILMYSKLVDMVQKHLLFYFIGGFYALFFLLIGYLLTIPGIGLDNTVEDPSRLIGWASYLGIESFGSLMVALFWSFVASSTSPESAKIGYPKIIFGAQFGSVGGPFLVTQAQTFGISGLMYISFTWILLMIILIAIYVRVLPAHLTGLEDNSEPSGSKKNTGMLEGIRLLFKYKYIAGIFCVATFYEIVGTILDFQMKVLAKQVYTTPESFAIFMAKFGIGCNLVTMGISLIGTSFIMKKWGLTFCIVSFPITIGCVVTFVYFSPSKEVFFAAMIIIKCFTYALNNPAKEILYIPTSKDIKFKTKGWIDMFGSRSMKAAGSLVNNTFKESTQTLLTYGTIMSLGVVFFWIFIAAYVGKTFEQLTKENKILS
jgi:AAA family ATP:ADP antiporter